MKQFWVLRLFVFVAAAAALGAAPSPTQANLPAPHTVTGAISFQYFMNEAWDIFVYALQLEQTNRMSVSSSAPVNSIFINGCALRELVPSFQPKRRAQ